MKLSELDVQSVADYLRIMPDDLDQTERALIDGFVESAKHYVLSYTGLTAEQADEHPDLTIAACCLAGDFYNNRDYNFAVRTGADKVNVNPTVRSILAMYSINLL